MDALKKKRFGQYFSGDRVAKLLAFLCTLAGDESVIDPMAGIGDMLEAVIRLGIHPHNVYGIEIDEGAANVFNGRIPGDRVFVGDAFSLAPYDCFEIDSWDVVITNPPYVRYQTMSDKTNDGLALKNAVEIRGSLRKIINNLSHLTIEEKACFQRIIKNYSGLSDLAVPSWLLCAALVKCGGVLAMVVPESWMSRDYALSVKYMLLKFFDIRYIVEDVNAAWFPEALVKTNLLVAQRVQLRDNFQSAETTSYKHIKLSADLIGELSLVDRLWYGEEFGIKAFRRLLVDDFVGDGFESKSIPVSDFISAMSTSSAFDKLMKKLEPSIQKICTNPIPNEIRNALHCEKFPLGVVNLSDWGVQIGQGLRTGANKFFYTEFRNRKTDCVDLLRVDSLFGDGIVAVAQRHTLPTLRYQCDAGDKYSVTKDMLPHRLLYIQEDLCDSGGSLRYAEDAPLADHIAAADELTFESNGRPTHFRELSAVKPNIRTTGQIRHWYMLPVLAKRHLPQLCVSRVNNKSTRCLLIADGIVVDANFSTLWTEPRNDRAIYSLLALMNSSWVQACLELIATVMGGGALKVEASHLRALPLPMPSDNLISTLYGLGERLATHDTKNSEEILLQIDRVVLSDGFGVANPSECYEKLRNLVTTKSETRKRRKIR